jgi:single-strand DNA-binding protein
MNEPSLTITGTACADADLKYTPTGKPVANLTVACNPRRLDQTTDQWVDGTPTFWSCQVWGPAAESVADSIRKGDRVMVIGRVKANVWTPSEGEHADIEQKRLDVIVDEIGLSLRFHPAKTVKTARATTVTAGDGDPAEAPF